MLYTGNMNLEKIKDVISSYFGRILLKSDIFEFTESSYYDEEMGKPIYRVFFGFDRLIDMESIVEIKLQGNFIEKRHFSENGKRMVNIDPGYLTLAKVVLATTKNFQHRLYLGNGIYAEVTLRWRKGTFSDWEWTYRDYRRDESIRFFNELRDIYRKKIHTIDNV